MKWTVNDLKLMQSQQEFVDTLLVPLVKIEGQASQLLHSAAATEFIMILSMEIENQFKGRVVLTPPITYVPSLNLLQLAESYEKEFRATGAKTIFYISTDMKWLSDAPSLNVHVVPSIPLSDMDVSMKSKIMEDQVRQVIPALLAKWNN